MCVCVYCVMYGLVMADAMLAAAEGLSRACVCVGGVGKGGRVCVCVCACVCVVFEGWMCGSVQVFMCVSILSWTVLCLQMPRLPLRRVCLLSVCVYGVCGEGGLEFVVVLVFVGLCACMRVCPLCRTHAHTR